MPMILREQNEAIWLYPETPIKTIQSLIKPYDESPIKAWPIDKKFQKMNPLAKETVQEIDTQEKLGL